LRIDFRRLLDTLFPPRCAGCGLRGVELCDRCLSTIRPLDPASCPRCGLPSRLGSLCDRCQGYDGPLSGIRTACIYDSVARKAIHGLKYRHRQTLARPLALILEAELRRRPLHLDLLAPVPLHPRRLAERGYNQSELLARELGEMLRIPVVNCLERRRETRAQAGLRATARRANVRQAFGHVDGVVLFGLRVGVVDDVCTTGATLEECAMALREAGCDAVWGIAVARDL
jgi:ComF family protein